MKQIFSIVWKIILNRDHDFCGTTWFFAWKCSSWISAWSRFTLFFTLWTDLRQFNKSLQSLFMDFCYSHELFHTFFKWQISCFSKMSLMGMWFADYSNVPVDEFGIWHVHINFMGRHLEWFHEIFGKLQKWHKKLWRKENNNKLKVDQNISRSKKCFLNDLKLWFLATVFNYD